MDLNTITSVRHPRTAEEVLSWQPSNAWLAGGTWLFSEPQPATDTLIDLAGLGWTPIEASADGLTIAATCRIAEIAHCQAPAMAGGSWHAFPLLNACCNAFLASFKIWNAATIGGNLCMSLPAGPMISLTAALEGVCTLWPRQGAPRTVPIVDFVTGNHANILAPGELLRSIHLPATALRKRVAMRQATLTKLGRSAALIIGTKAADGVFILTITAATDRPVQLHFSAMPDAAALDAAVSAIPEARWFADVHGSAPYKRHVTHHFAAEIRAELESA
jgi:CO/xanthine dehydrogenase FAD-binding subunit